MSINKTNSYKKYKTKIVCLNSKEIFSSITEGSKKYGIDRSSVSRCCKGEKKVAGKINGDRLCWMYYDDYLKLNDIQIEEILNENCGRDNKAKVICLNTKEVFDSITEASKKSGIVRTTISSCCRGVTKTAGEINGDRLCWMYYNEYLNLNDIQIEEILNKNRGGNNKVKVICLNTKEVFNSTTEASKKYGITRTSISRCCKGENKTAGKINNKKAIWMYYDEYLKTK